MLLCSAAVLLLLLLLLQAMSLFESGALPSPFTAGALQAFSPNFIGDHAVAM
jgi:hypothetical protein